MDLRQEKLLFQRTHRGALRTRERNLTEKRMLDNYISKLESKSKRQEDQITKEMKNITEEIYKKDLLQSDDDSDRESLDMSIADIKSEAPARAVMSALVTRSHPGAIRSKSAPMLSSYSCPKFGAGKDTFLRADSAVLRWKENRNKVADPPVVCKFDTWRKQCTQFPCVQPGHYNNIGFQVDYSAKKASDRFITSTQISAKSREKLLDELEMSSVRRPRRSVSARCSMKEKALYKNMATNKLRSQLARPPDWCTNYGTPTPRRKLLRLARPVGGSADLAGL